jgi:hypothetical protein
VANLINGDCYRLCNVKLYICENEKENWSCFIQNQLTSEGILLSVAMSKPPSPDHKLLKTLGMWESRVRLPLPGQKIGFGTGVKGQV